MCVCVCVCACVCERETERVCFCVSLTGCHGLRVVVVIITVVLQAEERWHTAGGAQALSQVGGCWVVGMHAVLRGHVVARQTAIAMGHLLHTIKHKNRQFNIRRKNCCPS